jgi:hypothetical protein
VILGLRIALKKNLKNLSVLLIVFCYFQQGFAATERDFQTWFNVTATGNFNKESKAFSRFKYWLEGQDRIGDNSSRSSQEMLRPGLGYSLTENTSLWLGYGWIHTGAPFTTTPFAENRIWQQLLWTKSYNYWTFLSRTRLEQRFLGNNHKVAYRARQLAKIVVPLKIDSNFSFVSTDELFWHKNNFIGRNSRGFDQNRFFIGFGYQLYPKVTIEIGYMNQYIRRVGVPNFCSNILAANLLINL